MEARLRERNLKIIIGPKMVLMGKIEGWSLLQ